MRNDLKDRNPVKVEDAACGCERYEVDGADANGAPLRSVICLHKDGCKPVIPRVQKGKEFVRVVRK